MGASWATPNLWQPVRVMPTLLTKVLPCVACGKLRHFYGVTEDFVPDNDLCLGCQSAKRERERKCWRQTEMPAK